jgi:transposase
MLNFYTDLLDQFRKMSPPITPDKALEHKEADIVKKSRFFEAFDTRTHESIRSIATQFDISEQTATYWLKQRRIQGSPAYRRSRKLSNRLGRQPVIMDTQIQCLLSPSNPVRNQHYEHQIQHFKLPCSTRTLQGTLQNRTNHARRYKSVRIKQLSNSNKKKRKEYGQEHQNKTINEF